jgi:hypothetical protein
MNVLDHYRGTLIGLAVHDAFGTTLEWERPVSSSPQPILRVAGLFTLSRTAMDRRRVHCAVSGRESC